MRSASGKALLYWNTLKHLKWIQWRYWLKNLILAAYERRFPDRVGLALSRRIPAVIARRPSTTRVAWFEKRHDGTKGMFRAEELLTGRFTFLNRSKDFPERVSWRNPELTYLWDFNLHYFEYLGALAPLLELPSSEDAKAASSVIRSWLHDWIDHNPCPTRPGWHPYPVSLRTIHWIKLLVDHPEFADDQVLRSLYGQLQYLERRLEGHLQVNHLLENGRALVFGGLYFEGKDSRRWFDTGMRILEREIEEEYLPHGGHFERSPMYHCILLEGLLDLYAYLDANGRDVNWLTSPLRKMATWLDRIKCPDGAFPLFNDAAVGISASPDEILAHASRLLGWKPDAQLAPIRDCDQFFVLDGGSLFCVVDGAPIGPSYNPGHAHSDNLGYELFLQGRRFVVDAGTSSYDVGPARLASRSTAAHNTVVVNGLDQSEVWGSFRVARRSNPTAANAGRCGSLLVFEGEYQNRVRPSLGITHHRIIALKPAIWMLVWDTVTANGDIRAESHCLFAPDWTIARESRGYRLRNSSREKAFFRPIRVAEASVGQGQYAPEFGKQLPTARLSLLTTGHRRIEMGYLITTSIRAADSDIDVKRDGSVLTIRLDDQEESIRLQELAP